MLARNSLLARLAASAASLAWRSSSFALRQLGRPLAHRLFDRCLRGLEFSLANGDGPHLAHALDARVDEEDVLENDPTGMLQPAPRAHG